MAWTVTCSICDAPTHPEWPDKPIIVRRYKRPDVLVEEIIAGPVVLCDEDHCGWGVPLKVGPGDQR